MSRALDAATANQRAAADPKQSVFVTANAGSGKTKVLVDRIARLLLEGSKPSAFLCITYTKAAAAEMQRRLFERLGGWCVASDEDLAAGLRELGAKDADAGRARALFAQALETPGGLKIQTIHGFCERLLARFPLEAAVPPGFDIADEARAAALLAQARVETALGADAPVEAFHRFATRLSGDALDRLLDRLALRRGEFHRFAQRHDSAALAEAQLRNRHGVRQSAEQVAAEFVARHDWRKLREAERLLRTGTAQDQNAADRLGAALECVESASPDALSKCFAFAFTAGGTGKLYQNFVTAGLRRKHSSLEPQVRSFAESCIEVRAALTAIERADDAIASLQLALMLDRTYQGAKQRAGALDFDDLIEHAHALLHRSDAAPWVLYKLDGGFDHILIDEGQDTSPRQWDLIAPLQDEFFAGAGARLRPRTIFAVGDPKQSIYAFQGADPDRFLQEAQTLAKRADHAKQAFAAPVLETSFRSTPEILRAVDMVFADKEIVTASIGEHDAISHLAARAQENGVVEVWPLAMRTPAQDSAPWDAPMDLETGVSVHAQLAKSIAARVKEMIQAREAVWDKNTRTPRPMQAGDVLALVRTRGAMFRELIKALKRAGLPVAGADRMVLRDELAVEDCLALIRVALDPDDDLALACMLKGPWCNLDDDDADIFPLAYGRRYETLHARLMATTDEKYAFTRAFVAELTARAGNDPFAFLSWALETPHDGATGWERVFARLGAETRDPLEELLQRALHLAPQEAPSLQRFLYDIEVDAGQVKRELEAESGAVRVMTVHGAKGLEAPVVILPDCTSEAKDKTEDGLIFDDDAGPYFSLRKGDDDTKCAAARAAHEARMLGEHWRLLYVAMTRARDRLIVCGAQWRQGESEESWRLAVEQALHKLGATPCATPYGEGLRLGALSTADAREEQERVQTPLPGWAKQLAAHVERLDRAAPSRIAHQDASLFSPRSDGQRRFRRGRLIHGLLERLPEITPARRADAARSWLAGQGAQESEIDDYVREALAVIDDPRFAAAFGAQSRAEAPIVGQAAGRAVRGVIDRLAIEGDRVLLVDFKTDRPAPRQAENAPPAYVLQLALYRDVLRSIFPAKRIECGLLWTEAPALMPLPNGLLDTALRRFQQG